jgi:hypothetical protein
LKVYFDNHEGVHALKESRIGVVSQMGLNQMKFKQAQPSNNWVHYNWWSLYYNLRGKRLLNWGDDLFNNLRHVLRLKVNPAGGSFSEEQFKPLGPTTWYREKSDF